MIYFIKDVVTQAVKIGYSSDPPKRLSGLQSATANQLLLLGAMEGGLEHEAALHRKFAQHRIQGEWFKGEILPEVLAILAQAAVSPPVPTTNVIVFGDGDFTDQRAIFAALDEIHAHTPITWIVTGGERPLDMTAWRWAQERQVKLYRYYPKWRTQGRFAGFKIGPKMLRSMFDPKILLVFHSSRVSESTRRMIRSAEKMGIPVVRKTACEADLPDNHGA